MIRKMNLQAMLGVPDQLPCQRCKETCTTYFNDYDIDVGRMPINGRWELGYYCGHCGNENVYKFDAQNRIEIPPIDEMGHQTRFTLGKAEKEPSPIDEAEYQTDFTIGKVIACLKKERARQREKWGEQSHPQLYWLGILMEELGEYAQSLIEEQDIITEDQDIERVESELIHVAATAIAALESLENHGIEGR